MDRLSTIGGGLGGVFAFIMAISIVHVVEIALYGLIGSLIGEGVKFVFERIKKGVNEK